MSCSSSARIAAAASGEDPAALEHAAGCASCGAALAEQRELRQLAAQAPKVRLAAARRAALRAELLAASDATPVRSRRRGARWVVASLGVAAAAAVVLLLVRGGSPDGAVARGSVAAVPASQVGSGRVDAVPASQAESARVEAVTSSAPPDAGAPAEPAMAELEARGARLERAGDLVKLADGAVTLDARGRRAARVEARGAQVQIADAKAEVTVRAGRLVQVHVFAGSAEVSLGGRAQVVEVGQVWTAPVPARAPALPSSPRAKSPSAPSDPGPAQPSPGQPAAPAMAPSAPSPALVAFRHGWEALRAGRNAEAIAAFDRAGDPAVAEDAAYWAAVAAARAGNRDDARRRMRGFLVAFPASPHAAEARAALATQQ